MKNEIQNGALKQGQTFRVYPVISSFHSAYELNKSNSSR